MKKIWLLGLILLPCILQNWMFVLFDPNIIYVTQELYDKLKDKDYIEKVQDGMFLKSCGILD